MKIVEKEEMPNVRAYTRRYLVKFINNFSKFSRNEEILGKSLENFVNKSGFCFVFTLVSPSQYILAS